MKGDEGGLGLSTSKSGTGKPLPFVTFYSNCSPSLGCVSTLRVEERRCHFHILQIYGFFFFIPFQEEAERVLPLYNLMINNSKKIVEI